MTEFKQLLICVDKNYTNFRLFDVSCVLPVLGSSCAQCLCLRLMQDFFVKNWFLLEGNRTKRQGIEIYLHGGKRSDTACLVYGSPHLYLVGPCIGGEGATSWCKRGNIFGAATYYALCFQPSIATKHMPIVQSPKPMTTRLFDEFQTF